MIPKIIHYCWFGNAEKSDSFERCLRSWEQNCPDFKIIAWNEQTSMPFLNKFAKDALRKKKYAFVADSVRVAVLHEMGGIYMDTDMLLIKPMESLLQHDFFTGFEVPGRPAYGLFGGVPGHRFFGSMKEFYDTTPFDGFNPPVITHTFKDLITPSNMNECEIILDVEILYPLPYTDRDKDYNDHITPNSIAVHLWDHSWSESKKETTSTLIKKLLIVSGDYLLHGYPYSYFKRYFREFSRKLYHRLTGKSYL